MGSASASTRSRIRSRRPFRVTTSTSHSRSSLQLDQEAAHVEEPLAGIHVHKEVDVAPVVRFATRNGPDDGGVAGPSPRGELEDFAPARAQLVERRWGLCRRLARAAFMVARRTPASGCGAHGPLCGDALDDYRLSEAGAESQGETVEEAMANLKEALELCFEDAPAPDVSGRRSSRRWRSVREPAASGRLGIGGRGSTGGRQASRRSGRVRPLGARVRTSAVPAEAGLARRTHVARSRVCL